MSTTLNALERVVERNGRATVSDPIALTGALRSLPDPPPDDEIAALAAAAGAGAVPRMRTALERGAAPADAVRAATVALDPAGGDPARRACTLLGAALGLLPRGWVDGDPAGDTAVLRDTAGTTITPSAAARTEPIRPGQMRPGQINPDPDRTELITPTPARHGSGRRRGWIAAVAGLVVLVAVAAYLLYPGPTTVPAPSAAAPPAPPTTSATTTPTAQTTATAIPVDPRAAFTDPALLAIAEPYLDGPQVACEAEDPGIDEQESVTCQLGPETAGIFRKLLSVDSLPTLREVFIDPALNENAEPGSIRSTRWESVPGRPGVRTGVPAASGRSGEGTRVRWFDAANGFPSLYFDEDASGATALLASFGDADQQLLRDYWADPDS